MECDLGKSASSFNIVAGALLPIVHVKNIGYALTNTLTPHDIDLKLTGLDFATVNFDYFFLKKKSILIFWNSINYFKGGSFGG